MSLVFMGTPKFAKVILARLLDSGFDVAAVVCQPDKPRGRDPNPAFPPVKELALKHCIDVFQPRRIRSKACEWLRKLKPDLVIVTAYGHLLPPEFLGIPTRGCVNVHASLLPAYRGPAPIQWAIAQGEKETGVSLMQMDEGVDTGPVIASRSIQILPTDTSETLHDKLASLGGDLLVEMLPDILAGRTHPVPQDERQASYAPMLKKQDAVVDWRWDGQRISDRARGFHPWPGTATKFRGKSLKLFPPILVPTRRNEYDVWSKSVSGSLSPKPGTILDVNRTGIVVQAGDGAVVLTLVQMEGKRRLDAYVFAQGMRLERGEKLG